MYENLTLDDITIRSSSHTSFFGVYLATHAILDGLCMCHASVGCKVKTQEHLRAHDGAHDAHVRRRYSQFIDEDLINGSTAQLENEILAYAKRQNPGIVVIDGSTPISLQAQPLAAMLERMEAATGVHVVHVNARNYDSDYIAGYASTIGTILKRLEWKRGERRADEVSIVGHLFDRYESDQVGNVSELRRLLWGLGLKAKAVFMSGERYAVLKEAVNARSHIVLPHARSQVKTLASLDREHIQAGLPMSTGGTRAWLSQVGRELRVEARAQAFIAQELSRVKPMAEIARRDLSRRRFAVFADAVHAAGVVATLMEVGMTPATIGTLHFSMGGRAEVERILAEHHGIQLPAGVEWLEDATPNAIAAARLDACDVVVGTTIERELLAPRQLPWIEFGFPSEDRHYLFPAPFLGFNGALRLLEQVLHALSQARGNQVHERVARK